MAERLARSEVPVDETWRLDDMFQSMEAWEAELAAVERIIPQVAEFQGRLGDGASVLRKCYETVELLARRFEKISTYAYLRFSEDGTNPVGQELMGRTMAAQARLDSAIAFMRPEILSLPDGTLEGYFSEEPGLETFRRRLELILSDRPYVLSAETETAIAALREVLDAPKMVYEWTKTSDISFEPAVDSEGHEVPVSFATYEEILEVSPDAALRRSAYTSFSRGLARYQNALAGTFAAEVKKNVALARIRGYESATHMFLHQQEVPVEVYHNLLDVIEEGLAPHMRRYVDLRRRVLGLDKIMYCDIEAPLDPDFMPEISYEEGARLIIDSVAVMGAEYADIIRVALEDRWIDRADNVGKSTGAFCTSTYDVHPYILATWGESMRSVFTIAHELGHAVQSVLASSNQRFVNVEPSLVFIEAPSTLNELLLAEHILESADDFRMRRWVLMQLLGTYYHNFVRHLLEAELVKRIYAHSEAGRPITAALLSAEKGDILESYWDGVVEIDDGAKLTWMRQPHYYAGLYSYTYSAGLTCATVVAQSVREEGSRAAERWVNVLKQGGSMAPLELMKTAGVDLEDAATIGDAVDYVGRIVDEVDGGFGGQPH
ncbi:MAG: oligoendopeptidase F [Bacillota bacterium]